MGVVFVRGWRRVWGERKESGVGVGGVGGSGARGVPQI